MDTKQLTQFVNALLFSDGFRFEQTNSSGHLVDEEGNQVVKLEIDFVSVIAELASNRALAGNIPTILRTVYLTHVNTNERSFKAGTRFGRAQQVRELHELMGINRIVEALQERTEVSGQPSGGILSPR